MRLLVLSAALLFTGCARYVDFTLPTQPGVNANITWTFEEQPAPVMERGEAQDVLNPSVVRRAGGPYLNAYSVYDGKMWRTRLAQSEDGLRWKQLQPSLTPEAGTWEGSYIAANGTALLVGPEIWYWYHSGPRERPRIGVARDWNKDRKPVLDPGPYMSWDEYGVADPYVIQIGEWFYMYFLGEDRAWRQRIGVARSRNGSEWQKLRSNPVLEIGPPGSFDENGLGEPAVWEASGYYWMLYTGRGAGEVRKLGMARSIDGVHWTKLPEVFAGARDWDAKVICDPTVLKIDDRTLAVWFGGGNVPRPDEGLNGQIGYGVLRMVTK
jgi:predicted GH43/DUF377 family glycosyl hydrolase